MQITIIRQHIEPGVRVYKPGDVVELADNRARIWIQHGIAAPFTGQQQQLLPPIETITTHETARRKPRRRESR